MSFFTNLRADRLIAEIKAADGSDGHRASLEKLVRLGPSAIPRVLDALASADKQETTGFVAVLTALLDNKSFPVVAAGLDRTATSARSRAPPRALSSSRNYAANLLFGLLDQPAMPKGTIVGILTAQKARLNARDVLQRAYSQDAAEKAAMFRIVADIADASIVPEMLSRLEGKDPIARTHIINILARFNRRDVAEALQRQLKDTNKFVRQAVLNALAGFEGNVDVGLLCEVLRDPDVETQQKAIDAVVRANHPDTMRHLIAVLRDEDENARRAAVEVLNEIGTPAHVKALLQSIKDDDWWVRSRAADALAKIGGPRVIEAALELIRDQDEDVRRAAIEILNQTKDERAIGYLIEATRDNDWWVRERAVDALAEIGSPRALPTLLDLLRTGDERSLPTVVRAIGKLGDPSVIPRLMPLLESPSKEARLEVITALARLVDDNSADVVRARLESFGAESADPTVSHAAMRAVEDMDARFSTGVRDAQQGAARMAEPSRTLLAEKPDFDGLARQAAPVAAARHLRAQAGRRARGPLQVPAEDRQGRLRHRAADGGHGRRRTAGAQVPEPERLAGRGDDEAVRARAALLAQDHAPQRHPHLRLPVHPRQLRDLDGVLSVAHARQRDQRQAAPARQGRPLRHGRGHRHGRGAPVRHHPPRPEARQRADRRHGPASRSWTSASRPRSSRATRSSPRPVM